MALSVPTNEEKNAEFSASLFRIANEITQEELKGMKFLCINPGLINALPRGKLDSIENPMEFLAFLQERGKIRPGDVTYLVSLLKKIENVQLANTVMKELGKMALYHRNFHSVNITKKLRQTLGIT